MGAFLLGNWRVLVYGALLLVAALAVGVTRNQLAGCRTDLAQARADYALLAARVSEQNAAIEALERAMKDADARARRARENAARVAKLAADKAQTLDRALHAPRVVASACPAGDALGAVRADLAAVR